MAPSRILDLVVIACVSWLSLVSQSANAATFHPAPPALLSSLTISPPGYVDSVYSNDFVGGFGDNNVLNYLRGFWGSSLVQVGTSPSQNCVGGTVVTCDGGDGFYDGPLANVFAIHWGGKGGEQPLLALKYDSLTKLFSILGLDGGVSFIRAYRTPEAQPPIVPLPPALVLFGTALIGLTVLGRRRRNAS